MIVNLLCVTKVSQHNATAARRRRHEYVFRFEIAMDNVLIVEVFEGDQNLSDYHSRSDIGKLSVFAFQEGEQIASSDEILEDITGQVNA